MFQRIIVPVDGSDFSWRAFGPALALARQCDATVEVVEVVTLPDDRSVAADYVRQRLEEMEGVDADSVVVTVLTMGDTIPSTLAAYVEESEGAVVVMSSVGRGRTAALIGSVAEELVGTTFGPVVVVGPKCAVDRADFKGELVVPIDGSDTSETALPLAAAWGIGLEARPWVVTVIDPDEPVSPDVAESSYPARMARQLSKSSHHDVEFEVLHHEHPATAIADYAKELDASLIVTSTHGRTGLPRLTMGSVASAIVHQAPCPVVLNRPPHLHD